MAPLRSSRYPKEYEDARVAVSKGRIDDALAIGGDLLNDPELPRYYRINTLILLASVSTEWTKTENLRVRAEHVWKESRDLYPEGVDTATDAALAELRILLDRLKTEQAKAVPPNYEDTLSAQLAETKIENLADFAEGEVEAMADLEWENEGSTGSADTLTFRDEDGSGVAIAASSGTDRTRDGFFSGSTLAPASIHPAPITQNQDDDSDMFTLAPGSTYPAPITQTQNDIRFAASSGLRAFEQSHVDDSNAFTSPPASNVAVSITRTQDGIGVAGPSSIGSIEQGQNGHSNTPAFAPASTLPASIGLLNNQGMDLGLSNIPTCAPATTSQASAEHGQNGHSETPMFTPASTLPASLHLLDIQDTESGPPAPSHHSRHGQTAGTIMSHRKHGFTRSSA